MTLAANDAGKKSSKLILAPAYDYTAEELRIFLASAWESVPEAALVLLRGRVDPGFLSQARQFHPAVATWVPPGAPPYTGRRRTLGRRLAAYLLAPAVSVAWRYLPLLRPVCSCLARPYLHVTNQRHLSFLTYLERVAPSAESVLLTDTRDVVFQGDPFVARPPGLLVSQEDRTVADCPFTTWWVCRLYPREYYIALRDKPTLCAGVTLGDRQQVVAYLRAMTDEILANLPKLALRGTLDQGIHNKVFWIDGSVPFSVSTNGTGNIATVGVSPPGALLVDDCHRIRCINGHVPSLVHQYDRHPILLESARARFLGHGESASPVPV